MNWQLDFSVANTKVSRPGLKNMANKKAKIFLILAFFMDLLSYLLFKMSVAD
jgi:hypothetical protein